MGDGLMKRRRMTSTEVGSLKKAMVEVVVEVKVGGHALPFLVDTNCHFCKKIWYLNHE